MSTELCQDIDLLQINMEIIAKELSDLIVTADQETRAENPHAMNLEHVSHPVPSHKPIPIPMPTNSWVYNTCYKQQQNGVTNGFQNVYFNQFYHMPPGCQGDDFAIFYFFFTFRYLSKVAVIFLLHFDSCRSWP